MVPLHIPHLILLSQIRLDPPADKLNGNANFLSMTSLYHLRPPIERREALLHLRILPFLRRPHPLPQDLHRPQTTLHTCFRTTTMKTMMQM
jgi:hypothetical protein